MARDNPVKAVFLILTASVMLPVSQGYGEVPLYPKGFHNGGTAHCDGCHSRKVQQTFTNSTSAASVAPVPDSPNPVSTSMLNGSDPSSTCLICHSAPVGQKQPSGFFIASSRGSLSRGIPPAQLTPGGDFGWLLKTYKWSSKGTTTNDESSPGDSHGHNVVAQDFGFSADLTNAVSPGGTYPADKLSCTSCHDPHGSYRRLLANTFSRDGLRITSSGSYSTSVDPDSTGAVGTYRMLAGIGYQPASLTGDFAFKADPPVAVAPPDYNRAEPLFDTRVAYGKGMTEWCRNCHVTTHKDAHPMGSTGKLTAEVIRIYNHYISSGKITGSKDNAYSSLVPFEMGTDDYTVLKAAANSNGSMRSGPKTGSNVMCLTCHRAHASGWDHSTRWNERTGMMSKDNAFVGSDSKTTDSSIAAQGRLSAETSKAYYDRTADTFGSYQRSMCSKCHQKD